jgi:UDP-N-acetyl-D-mannosaminuronate dehydrogenase
MLVAEDDLRANTHTLADKILIIGLGQLGLPVAKYVKEKGFDVYGYDISQKAIQRAEKIAAIKKADNFSEYYSQRYVKAGI